VARQKRRRPPLPYLTDRSYLAVRRLVASDPSNDRHRYEMWRLAVRIFGSVEDLSFVVMDEEDAPKREAAIRKLRGAARALNPKGRPPDATVEDVERDWPAIEKMAQQFHALMKDIAGLDGLDGTSAREAVEYLRRARVGDTDSLDVVRPLAPSFLEENALQLRTDEMDRFLAAIENIRRPNRDWLPTFAARAISAKYRVSDDTAHALLKQLPPTN
jgi:hypothetical protein